MEENSEFPNISHIVITGGEPLLQQTKLVSLLRLIKRKKAKRRRSKKSHHYYIEMETNGTLIPLKEL